MPRLPFLFSLAALIFALLVALVGRPSGPSINPFYDPGTGKSTHILLLTAHPDDECMFFAPTLLALTGGQHETELGTNHKSGLVTNSKLNSGSQTQSQLDSDGIATTPDEVNKKDMGNDKVYSLCLSTGDADGLGGIRKNELGASLDVLGVPEGRRWVLEEPYVMLFIGFLNSFICIFTPI